MKSTTVYLRHSSDIEELNNHLVKNNYLTKLTYNKDNTVDNLSAVKDGNIIICKLIN